MDWAGLLHIFLIPLSIGYIVGSVPFGLVLSYLAGYGDIRKIGSGNIGTTNVLRTGNKLLAFVTLLCDAGKGGIIILIAFGGFPATQHSEIYTQDFSLFVAFMYGVGAILGHCFPVWLKFKGGKGVATGFGVLLAAAPYSALAAFATWLLVAVTTRYSSLSALCACAIAPIVTFFVYGTLPALACTIIIALILVRHKENIKRLLAGTESKIGQKKSPGQDDKKDQDK